MPNLTKEENWAARARLRRVEFLLWWRGWVGRTDLVESFGISAAQASGDLQRYAAMNEGALVYHTSRKRYEATESMICVLHEPVFAEAVRHFLGESVSGGESSTVEAEDSRISVVRLPGRRLELRIARRVLMSLLERRQLRVRYHSVNSGRDEWRELVPAGLGWDGMRWHVRAWSVERGEWRDFALGRMLDAGMPGGLAGELPEDLAWTTFETIRLRLNPGLDAPQRQALRFEYGLAGETLEIRVRSSMKPYLLASMFIDRDSHLQLPRHFVMEE
jgi:hypothetical protein